MCIGGSFDVLTQIVIDIGCSGMVDGSLQGTYRVSEVKRECGADKYV